MSRNGVEISMEAGIRFRPIPPRDRCEIFEKIARQEWLGRSKINLKWERISQKKSFPISLYINFLFTTNQSEIVSSPFVFMGDINFPKRWPLNMGARTPLS